MLKPLITVAAALTLISFGLFLLTPHSFNVLVLQADRLLVFALGCAALIAALARRRLRPTGTSLLAGLSAWLLLPLIAGPLLVGLATAGLMQFYHSPFFRQVNSAQHGVRIELVEQEFNFATQPPRNPHQDGPPISLPGLRSELARCWIGGYVATYRIEVQRDQQLTFALAATEDEEFFDRSDLPALSIRNQLRQVGEGRAEGATWHGLFQMPQGSHTIVVRGQKPFLLQVYGVEPLWTPNLLLAGERRYAPLYADDLRRADFEATSRSSLPAACAPLGCPEDSAALPWLRTPPLVEDSAAIRGVAAEEVLDLDGDGRYNVLQLGVVLDIATKGEYVLEGTLSDATGRDLARATYETPDREPLCLGEQTVNLNFSGRGLGNMMVDGPYTLSLLTLAYEDDEGYYPTEVDWARDLYTTAPYRASQFGGDR